VVGESETELGNGVRVWWSCMDVVSQQSAGVAVFGAVGSLPSYAPPSPKWYCPFNKTNSYLITTFIDRCINTTSTNMLNVLSTRIMALFTQQKFTGFMNTAAWHYIVFRVRHCAVGNY
jgi:hypothetical protein